jgi:hypothetical protein
MRLSLPATVLPPTRADLLRRDSLQSPHSAADGECDLSLTVTIEDDIHHTGRRFAFRASRGTANPQPENKAHHAGLIVDGRPMSAAVLEQQDIRSSARFLAGAIAQARPATVLHNPPFREAAGAYRRSHDLDAETQVPRFRSDKRV